MGSNTDLVKANAARKGWSAALTGGLTVLTTASAISLGLVPIAIIAGVSGAIVTTRRTYEWLRYRGTWGLRF